jgi:hypothetical protein
MILLAWLGTAILMGLLIAECKSKAETKPSKTTKDLPENKREKIHRIK